MYVNRITYGTRRRDGIPSILSDGNTVGWYDYLLDVTKDGSDFVSAWGDQSGENNHLLQASGTAQPLWTVNGVLLDGIDNYMKTAPFVWDQPEMIYMVAKQVTWTSTDRFFDGNISNTAVLQQITTTPNLRINAGTNLGENTNLPINTYAIIRVLFNGASSKLQINETAALTGDAGASDADGLTLGRQGSGIAQWGNIEVKETILRKIADITANEAIIYNYLKSKYRL